MWVKNSVRWIRGLGSVGVTREWEKIKERRWDKKRENWWD